MTASEIFESITGSGSSDFALLARILNKHGQWCLIGGLAVNCYVEPVYTLDADIVAVSSQLQSIKEALVDAGFLVEEFPHSITRKCRVVTSGFNLRQTHAIRTSCLIPS